MRVPRLVVVFIVFLAATFAGCGHADSEISTIGSDADVSEASFLIDELEFSSLTEFLKAHQAAVTNRSTGISVGLDESADLAGLENLYLPTGIPETYRLFMILVNENFVTLWYLPEEHLISEEAIRFAINRQQHFLFSFTRGHVERFGSPKDALLRQFHISESDLIDGRYYFNGRNFFMWASDNEQMFLYTPLPTTDPQGNHRIGTHSTGFTTFNLDEPPSFTQIRTVDLTNPVEAGTLLQEQIPTPHQIDFRLDRYTETADWGSIAPIEILSNTNILDFLLANHSGFSEDGPIREGYDFMGWYLNPAFVNPLTEFTRMPARNTTLYAAWQPSAH